MNRGMNKPSLKQTLEGQSIELVKHVLSPPVQHWIAPTTASAMGRAKTQKRSSFFARERMSSLTEQDEEREEQTWGHSNQCHRLICDMINSRKNPRRKHLFARLINKRDREKESLHPTEGCREREKRFHLSLSPVLREQQTITYWWQISSSSSSWWKTFVSLLELRERGNRTKEKIIIVMGKKKETETENCCRRAKDSNEVWERERGTWLAVDETNSSFASFLLSLSLSPSVSVCIVIVCCSADFIRRDENVNLWYCHSDRQCPIEGRIRVSTCNQLPFVFLPRWRDSSLGFQVY